MKKENIQFENSAGEKLAGILDLPTSTPRAYALFAHCFTCSKNIRAATIISRALIEAGFAVLRFDFTGLGQSERTAFLLPWQSPQSALQPTRLMWRICSLTSGKSWRRQAAPR